MPLPTRLLLVFLVSTLAGCVREDDAPPPASFPALDPARMAGRPECPDLTGGFSTVAATGSDPTLARALLAEPGVATLRVTQAGASLQIASWWSPDAVAAAARDLAGSDRGAYGRWWTAAREVLSQRLGPEGSAAASDLPGPAPVRIGTLVPTCADGWMEYGEVVDMAKRQGARHASTLRLARDAGGGLVLRSDVDVDRVELPLWCGDGCQGPTLYVKRETRWARFPPAPAAGAWAMDFAALPVPVPGD